MSEQQQQQRLIVGVDKFENIVALLLEEEGFWVRRGFKVALTQDEKRQIGKTSAPKPEIDMLAYHPGRQELLVLEVKAYQDTPGVKLAQMQEVHEVPTGRFKLFTSDLYRQVVFTRLQQQLLELGQISDQTQLRLGLIPGKVNQGQSEALRALMQERDWFFWSPDEVKAKVAARSAQG